MPRISKTRVLIETRMPDGGFIQLPATRKMTFNTIPEAEKYVNTYIQPGQVWRISKVTGEYFVSQQLVKR